MINRPVLPPLATTGIGSLPHHSADEALAYSLRHDVPFLPELPALDPAESMLPRALHGLVGLHLHPDGSCHVDLQAWRRTRDRLTHQIAEALSTSSLEAFEVQGQAVRPFFQSLEHGEVKLAKVQIAGPITVARFVKTDEGAPLESDDELRAQVQQLVMAKSLALVRAVARAGATALIFLDEPGLTDRPTAALVPLIAALLREGALVGVHCCANADWPALLALGLDVISFDARLSLDAVIEHTPIGPVLGLGIIPTSPNEAYRLRDLVESVEASLRATLLPGIAFESVLARTLLTPACGLGNHTLDDAERIGTELHQAQRALRDVLKL